MTRFTIIVAAFDSGRPAAADLHMRLADAWPENADATLHTALADTRELDDLDPKTVGAVILIVARTDATSAVFGQVAGLDEAGIAPVVILTDPDDARRTAARPPFGDTLIVGADADMTRLCATLRGVIHRQHEVIRLRHEISLAQHFHGGLEGEISRMHEELQLAAMVQREFLPRTLPRLFGVSFAALWRPAHYVSGDIYDVSRLDDDHVGVFIADAIGHGVPAALMTMVISRSLITKIISGSSYRLVEPRDVLDRLNQDMIRRRGSNTRFATGAYALVNCRTRTMRFAGAGHPPPLVHSSDGTVREVNTPGGLLGVFEGEEYEQIEVDLKVGDRLFLHSDGFEQAFPKPEADAYECRLPTQRYREEFLSIAATQSPQEIIETIGRRLDDQAGSLHQPDDLTLICMEAGAMNPTMGEVSTPNGVSVAA